MHTCACVLEMTSGVILRNGVHPLGEAGVINYARPAGQQAAEVLLSSHPQPWEHTQACAVSTSDIED